MTLPYFAEMFSLPFYVGRHSSASYESDLRNSRGLESVAEQFMIVSLLCSFSGGKELNLSECALTNACGWTNLRSSAPNTS